MEARIAGNRQGGWQRFEGGLRNHLPLKTLVQKLAIGLIETRISLDTLELSYPPHTPHTPDTAATP